MLRVQIGLVLSWIVVATLHVSAQQPTFVQGARVDPFARIRGNALSSTDSVLANAPVRLRDARLGRIIETQTTDTAGLFAFRPVDPGNYVVELLGRDQISVLAASPILSVEAGQAVSTVVKLPHRVSQFAQLFGGGPGTAAALAASAALAGVLTIGSTGTPTCDILQ